MKKVIASLFVINFLFFCPADTLAGAPIKKIDLKKIDSDHDGISDWDEINLYKTDPNKADTDGDGFSDLIEIKNGYSPHDPRPGIKLQKYIEVDTKKQELTYFFDKIKINTFKVSTGKPSMPTPKGKFKIKNKYERAWSKKYKLWMPFWMGLKDGSFGLHELPEWPNGYKEGLSHLGRPVSHGCVRLGVGQAEILYQWAEVGTTVNIK